MSSRRIGGDLANETTRIAMGYRFAFNLFFEREKEITQVLEQYASTMELKGENEV